MATPDAVLARTCVRLVGRARTPDRDAIFDANLVLVLVRIRVTLVRDVDSTAIDSEFERLVLDAFQDTMRELEIGECRHLGTARQFECTAPVRGQYKHRQSVSTFDH